jgi:PXA domain
VAVLLKEFVQTWYGKMTPDHGFVEEVLRTLAHCTRALEERVRTVDLEAVVLDELPGLVDGHVKGE